MVVNAVHGFKATKRACSVPQTELYHLVINMKLVNIVLEHSGFTDM